MLFFLLTRSSSWFQESLGPDLIKSGKFTTAISKSQELLRLRIAMLSLFVTHPWNRFQQFFYPSLNKQVKFVHQCPWSVSSENCDTFPAIDRLIKQISRIAMLSFHRLVHQTDSKNCNSFPAIDSFIKNITRIAMFSLLLTRSSNRFQELRCFPTTDSLVKRIPKIAMLSLHRLAHQTDSKNCNAFPPLTRSSNRF